MHWQCGKSKEPFNPRLNLVPSNIYTRPTSGVNIRAPPVGITVLDRSWLMSGVPKI